MEREDLARGKAELRHAWTPSRGLLAAVAVFSVATNLLMLTGPLYMLQVYDRVLSSRSEETLVALSLIAAGMFVAMGVLDHARGRIMARIGARFQDALDLRVFRASLRRLALAPDDATAIAAQRDLEAVQKLWSSPVMLAVFDLPWTPLFAAAVFVFHPALGWLALGGGAVLVLVTLANQRLSRMPLHLATAMGAKADRVAENLKGESEVVQALGMTSAGFARWQVARSEALAQGVRALDVTGGFGTLTRTLRLLLQSAMLGLGAWLVLHDGLGAGAMIASSILMGRALAPIESAIGQWAVLGRGREGWARLTVLLSCQPPDAPRTALPRPKAVLEVQAISVIPPGERQAVLRMVSLTVQPGQALGVIGPSGSGKSSLARALTGAWTPAAGRIRLDGATLDQYDPDVLGSYVGYLPQRVTLFEGTIAENIARLQIRPDAARVVAAAKAAAAHEMILRLPEGYDSRVSSLGGRLSGGQIQRIGLARAMYGDPVLLVLDEPNSNLDNEGSLALNAAIRAHKAAGGAVMIMAHRPAAIQECEMLMVMEDGTRRAYGPRDAVLREMVRNHTDLVRTEGAA